jgi:hypothetical protein
MSGRVMSSIAAMSSGSVVNIALGSTDQIFDCLMEPTLLVVLRSASR